MTVRELYDVVESLIEDGYEDFEVMVDSDITDYSLEDVDIDEIHKEASFEFGALMMSFMLGYKKDSEEQDIDQTNAPVEDYGFSGRFA